MRIAWAAGAVVVLAVGCASAPEPGALDYFPLSADGYWIFEGSAGGRPIRAGIRGAGVAADGAPRLEIAWERGEVMQLTAHRTDGFLELAADRYRLRVLPEHPGRTRSWEWENDGERWIGRVVRDDGYCIVPAGRYADVLEVELGPATGGGERWRWFFVVGVGPIKQRAISPTVGGAATLELVQRQEGTPLHVPRTPAPEPPAAAPAGAPAPAAGTPAPPPANG